MSCIISHMRPELCRQHSASSPLQCQAQLHIISSEKGYIGHSKIMFAGQLLHRCNEQPRQHNRLHTNSWTPFTPGTSTLPRKGWALSCCVPCTFRCKLCGPDREVCMGSLRYMSSVGARLSP